jgi:hypothetical protein
MLKAYNASGFRTTGRAEALLTSNFSKLSIIEIPDFAFNPKNFFSSL